MKAGINATCIGERPSGARQRFVGVYGALFREKPDWEFIVYEPADCDMKPWFGNAPNVRFRKTPLMSASPLQRFAMGRVFWADELRSSRLDVFEGLHLPLVSNPHGATVLTIHDVRGVRADGGLFRRSLYMRVLNSSVRRADRVITVSNAMQGEILRELPDARVSVVYNGIDLSSFADVEGTASKTLRGNYRLPHQFVLAVGHFEPRKNYGRLLSAIKRLHEQGRRIGLVVVGNDSGGKNALQQRAQSLGLGDSVHLLSGLSDRELRSIYRLSSLFVFPSLYEGFGIPLLEAMAAECPFVVSDLPVFRELTQGSAVYFSPNDVDSMADAIGAVLASDLEQDRLRRYGKRRVRDFDFSALGRQLAAVYRQVA